MNRSRRLFISLMLASTTSGIPLRAKEGLKSLAVVISTAVNDDNKKALQALSESLRTLGWTEGENLSISVHWGGAAEPERLQRTAEEVVRARPDAILANSASALIPLANLTSEIPIVFTLVADPVNAGYVASAAKPGGNLTGFANYEANFITKWRDVLQKVVPSVRRMAVLHGPTSRSAERFIGELTSQVDAPVLDYAVQSPEDVRRSFGSAASLAEIGVIVLPDPATSALKQDIIDEARRQRVPAIYPFRHLAEAGGLVAYGLNIQSIYEQAAVYVDRIFRGTQPGELPIQFPTRLELVINLRTAQQSGFVVPLDAIALADKVIE